MVSMGDWFVATNNFKPDCGHTFGNALYKVFLLEIFKAAIRQALGLRMLKTSSHCNLIK